MVETRIFLLDDHEVVRRGIRDLLEDEEDFVVVGEAGTAAEALARIPALKPDVAVLDARLSDGSGVEVCRRIREKVPQVAVVILTSYEDDDTLFDAISAGAAGFLLKQIRSTDLVEAVRRVAAGLSLLDPAVTSAVLARLRATPKDPLADLTEQERRVFEHLCDGRSNREIGAAMVLSEKTIKNYVSVILQKLGLERRAQAGVFAREHGLR